MAEIALETRGLGKQYLLGQLQTGYKLASEAIVERFKNVGRSPARETFWAVRDLDFEVRAGETYGIIGHNGAGKSTLLKLLSRVTPPSAGEIRVRGRVGALLEVGTGFHPELTGRENIYLNGAILGMHRSEIARKFDEIVDFAEVERFIDTPVKRYSSGMYLRLAFAVAAHLEPDVLVVDEVLSVGDLSFQEKCLGRMERVADEGRTVLFVSHNLTAVQNLCPRSMLLSRGQKVMEGPTPTVIEEYIAGVRRDAATDLGGRNDREGTGRLRFTSIHYESAGRQVDIPATGEEVDLVLGYETSDGRPVRAPVFAVGVYSMLGVLMLQLQSDVTGARVREAPPAGEIRCRVPKLPLPAGSYTVNLFAHAGSEIADWVQRAATLTVAEGDYFGSGHKLGESHQSVLVDHAWELRDAQPAKPATAR